MLHVDGRSVFGELPARMVSLCTPVAVVVLKPVGVQAFMHRAMLNDNVDLMCCGVACNSKVLLAAVCAIVLLVVSVFIS